MSKIRIRHGEDEIEVEGSDSFIKKQLDSFYQRVPVLPTGPPATLKKDIQAATDKKTPGRLPTPAEFYKAKNPRGGVSQILVFGKYLEEYRGKPEFTPQEINQIAGEAKLKNIHGQHFTNAVKQGLLRSRERGKYSLALSAEDVLAAMK